MGARFIHNNYLATPVVITNETSTSTQLIKTDPWGVQTQNSYTTDFVLPTEFGYTGHRKDHDSGLTYAHARYLSNTNRVWLSHDPFSIENFTDTRFLLDPQAQNSYSYVKNDPMNNVDPDGKVYQYIFASAVLGIAYLNGTEVAVAPGANDDINSYNQRVNLFDRQLANGLGANYDSWQPWRKQQFNDGINNILMGVTLGSVGVQKLN